jgi:hypothetical protein
MKSIEQHLQELQEPHRSQALANMWWEDRDNKYATNIQALRNAFNWSKSKEGTPYWYDLETTLLEKYLEDPTMEALDRYITAQLQKRGVFRDQNI